MPQNQTRLKAPPAPAVPLARASRPPAGPAPAAPGEDVRPSRRRLPQPKAPVLRFSPTAWAKLLFFRDRQETEMGGFAVTPADDLLQVEEFATIRQEVTAASVAFDDQAVADFFDAQVDAGKKPEQFARIWLHSHPGDSPQPSCTDETTFCRVFGRCDWAVMFIVAQNGNAYARLRFNVGPGGQILIPVQVDYGSPFGPADHPAWEAEYKANIQAGALSWDWGDDPRLPGQPERSRRSGPNDWLEDLEAMDPTERLAILEELDTRPDLWGGEGEGVYAG